MYQTVNLSWKIAFQNTGCVFAYFRGRYKNNFGYNFLALLKKILYYFNWISSFNFHAEKVQRN